MIGRFTLPKSLGVAIICFAISACASGPRVVKIMHDPDFKEATFHNILVIGVASNYDGRAQFERTVVSRINGTGSSATAYHTVLGHNPAITRSDIINAIRSRGFDAVLLTRVKGQEDTNTETQGAPVTLQNRRAVDNNVFNLFRFDYVELNNPMTINITSAVTLVTELYDVRDEKKAWAIETENSSEHVGLLIDAHSEAIVRALRRDKLIGP